MWVDLIESRVTSGELPPPTLVKVFSEKKNIDYTWNDDAHPITKSVLIEKIVIYNNELVEYVEFCAKKEREPQQNVIDLLMKYGNFLHEKGAIKHYDGVRYMAGQSARKERNKL